jgi:hypothetical protein
MIHRRAVSMRPVGRSGVALHRNRKWIARLAIVDPFPI